VKVAVLAPGPSLSSRYTARFGEGCDLVIAVNTAGWLYPCDWLAFSDTHILAPITSGDTPPPFIGYLTNKGQAANLASTSANGPRIEILPLYDRHLGQLSPRMSELAKSQGTTECGYTFPNALHFALSQGSTDLHVFGFDCAEQEEDVAGVKGYHTPKRWATELPWVREVLKGANYTLHGDATL
jgi:hypothetical protein